ncbi:MAG: tol-pal system protein YbgF [Rhodocyclaceae bacterium]|nr:tol-pal system protein YbgF [Rhodocyclaceae bacterium]
MSSEAMRRGVLILLCAGMSAAHAGLFDDEEARRQIRELRNDFTLATQRLEAIEKRLDAATRNHLGIANEIEALRAELSPLRGQLEVLHNALNAALKRQQDFYVDLDARVRKLEAQDVEARKTAPFADVKPDPQAEMRAYEAALTHFREGRYGEAQAAFEAFIAAHPKSTLLPNAYYWLGSSLYQQKRFDDAAKAYGQVAQLWPQDAKAPEALLGRANALIGAKDVAGAIKALEELIARYPHSAAAETARARLKTLAPTKKR